MKFHKHISIFLGVLMWFYVILPCTFSPSPYPHLPMAPGFCASTCRATTKPPKSTFQATWPAGWDDIWWTKIEGDLRNLVYQFGNNFCRCLFVPCYVLRVFQQVPPKAGFVAGWIFSACKVFTCSYSLLRMCTGGNAMEMPDFHYHNKRYRHTKTT